MRRSGASAAAVAGLVLVLAACAGGDHAVDRTLTPESVALPTRSPEVLSLSGLGKFDGKCPRGARSWALQFVNDSGATDIISYRVGSGRRHTVNVDNAITFHLVPATTRTHEPADRFVPPVGQGRGRTNAMSVRTTSPINAVIYQATEPQTLQADVHLALSSSGGGNGQCVLVGSTVHAYTYLNG